ncbi:MAG: hypothetical protein NW202_13340 [Nitrospira sp.]|nr:hypothetical protein [Nitrospira sp.]
MGKYIGPKDVRVDSLVLSSDFSKRLGKLHVNELADSLEQTGRLLQRIGVNQSDNAVIWGEDRVAAHMHLEREEIPAEIWDLTSMEVAMFRRVENVRRRYDSAERDKSILELHEILEKMFASNGAVNPKEAATQELAAQIGTKPGSVERSMRKEKARRKEKTPPVDTGPETDAPIVVEDFETFGVPMDADFAYGIRAIKQELKRVDQSCRDAQSGLTAAINAGGAPPARLKALQEEVHDIGAAIRNLMPHCICVYCKTVVETCGVCGGRNWNTVEQFHAAPEALRDWNQRRVMSNGKIVTMTTLASQPQSDEDLSDLL